MSCARRVLRRLPESLGFVAVTALIFALWVSAAAADTKTDETILDETILDDPRIEPTSELEETDPSPGADDSMGLWTWVWIGSGVAVLGAAAAGAHLIRRRRSDRRVEVHASVEEPLEESIPVFAAYSGRDDTFVMAGTDMADPVIPPMAGTDMADPVIPPMAGTEMADPVIPVMAGAEIPAVAPEPVYAGAADPGAYDIGGAAYAQHVSDPLTARFPGGADSMTPPDEGPRLFANLQATMIDMADRAVAQSGKEKTVASKLEAAGSQMRPGEWLIATGAVSAVSLLVVGFVLGWVIGLSAGAVAVVGSWWLLGYRANKRIGLFADQLPETLQLLSGALRSGMSLIQAMQTIADEAESPTSDEFQRVLTESRLGRDLGASLRDLAARSGSKDFGWVVTAIEINREVGGDLASILDRVSSTIRARNRVRGQVQALSAEGKMSGLILFMLPPAMIGLIAVMNREYLNEMVTTSDGQVLLALSGALLLIGGAWMKRLARFVY